MSEKKSEGTASSKKRIQHVSRRPVMHHPHHEHEEGPNLGMAGNIAHFFIDSPLTPLLFFATLFLPNKH